MTSPSTPPSSSSLRDYRVLSLLGEGTFGRVSLVQRLRDGARFVWKELHYGSMTDKEKSQLVNEVNLMRELRHPNIVAYHDRLIDRERRIIYIVMEHCSGGDLSAAIKHRRRTNTKFAPSFIWKVLGELSLAISACHERQCVHRDIKPSNALIDSNGNIKLCDFGLARLLSASSNHAQTHAGTPYYMSPEQIIHSRASEKSDAWALGCLAYELCTLRPPFMAANQLALARAIEKGEYDESPVIAEYGNDMARVIRGLLSVDVKKRWSVAQLLKQPKLQQALTSTTNTPTSTGFSTPPSASSLAARERSLAERERALLLRESECEEREKLLTQREERVRQRERELRARISPTPPQYIHHTTSPLSVPVTVTPIRIDPFTTKLKRLTPISQPSPAFVNKENFENKRSTQLW